MEHTMQLADYFNINVLWLIDLFLLALLFFMIWLGRKRGLIRSASGLVSMLGAWFCADRFSPLLHDFLKDKVFAPLVSGYVRAAFDTALSGVDTAVSSAAEQLAQKIEELQGYLQAAGLLPSGASVNMDGFFSGQMGLDTVGDELTQSISEPIAERLASVSGYLLVFLFVFALLLIVFCVIDLLVKLPILDKTNQMLGGILGFLKGIVYIWLLAQAAALVLGILYTNGTLPAEQTPGPVYGLLTLFGISGKFF